MRSRFSNGFVIVLLMSVVACSSGAPQNSGGQRPNGAQFSGRVVAVSVAPVSVGTIQSVLSYSGSIQPKAQVNVVPKTSGRIEKVLVDVGSVVHAGDAIAQFEQASAQVQLQQAEAGLAAASAKLATMKAGARAEDVASAQATVDSAQAKVDQLTPTEADVTNAQSAAEAAQAALTKAQGDLAKLKEGPTQDDIMAAKADLDKKQAALQQAQTAYDKVSWRGDIAAQPEAVALRQATADYQAALAAYNLKIAPPKPEDLATAEKNVESATAALASAQAKVAELKSGPKAPDLAAAQAGLDLAKDQLALKAKPYTKEDIAGGEAAVAQAQAAIDAAKLALDDTTVVAPFDGIIATRSLSAGAVATTQTPIVSLVSADVELQINVEEARIGQFRSGLPVTVAVPAYPNTDFSGSVAAITPVADSKSHTFLVKIALDNSSGQLSSGMFGSVKVVADRHDNALLVPKDALVQQGDKQVVFVTQDGKASARDVQVGVTDEQNVEILAGASADDQVVVAGQSSLNDGDRVAISGQMGPGQSQNRQVGEQDQQGRS